MMENGKNGRIEKKCETKICILGIHGPCGKIGKLCPWSCPWNRSDRSIKSISEVYGYNNYSNTVTRELYRDMSYLRWYLSMQHQMGNNSKIFLTQITLQHSMNYSLTSRGTFEKLQCYRFQKNFCVAVLPVNLYSCSDICFPLRSTHVFDRASPASNNFNFLVTFSKFWLI